MPLSSSSPIELRCPKCAGEMLTYERSGIHIDQCRECRGIFLDRGELERLIDLEAEALGLGGRGPLGAMSGDPGGPTAAGREWDPYRDARGPGTDPGYRRGRRNWDDDDDWDDRPRSRRSFLGDLFDFD